MSDLKEAIRAFQAAMVVRAADMHPADKLEEDCKKFVSSKLKPLARPLAALVEDAGKYKMTYEKDLLNDVLRAIDKVVEALI